MKQFDIDQVADAIAGLSVSISPFISGNVTADTLLSLMIQEKYISKEYQSAILASLRR